METRKVDWHDQIWKVHDRGDMPRRDRKENGQAKLTIGMQSHHRLKPIQIVSFTIQNRPDAPLPLEHVRVATLSLAKRFVPSPRVTA